MWGISTGSHTHTGLRTKENIKAMHFDVSLSINGIRETSKLRDPAKVRDKVLVDLSGTGGLADILELLVMY